MASTDKHSRPSELAIWGFAFGYFASYIPYSALVKAVSRGLLNGVQPSSFEILPLSVFASVVGMLTFLTLMGWWKYAGHRRIFGASLPCPGRFTFLSGVCTTAIIATTTLAYTFQGISIVFAMLLMRGGVLIIAPIVDSISRRRVRWFSWMGLVLSLSALVVAFSERAGYQMRALAAVDISLYLLSYFIRLRFMSHMAKSPDPAANKRYFVEEQIVAAPLLLILLGFLAVFGVGDMGASIRNGFVGFWGSPILLHLLLIGLFSQGTGIFGGLILLQKQENTYCVPVNRSSSVLAGVFASYALTIFLGQSPPSTHKLVGAGLIVAAILFLTIPTMLKRREPAGSVSAAPDGVRSA